MRETEIMNLPDMLVNYVSFMKPGIVHANLNVSIAVNFSDSSIVLMVHSFIGPAPGI